MSEYNFGIVVFNASKDLLQIILNKEEREFIYSVDIERECSDYLEIELKPRNIDLARDFPGCIGIGTKGILIVGNIARDVFIEFVGSSIGIKVNSIFK